MKFNHLMTNLAHLPPITDAIAKLRATTVVNVQSSWRYSPDFSQWYPVELNEKNYITFPAGRQVIWLKQTLVLPQQLQGYPVTGLALRLALTWWAESAQIFVNGCLVQEGDLFDNSTRLLLSKSVSPGEEINVVLRLVSPGHDKGAFVRSLCLYESTSGIEPGFVADELEILQGYLSTFAPEKLDNLAAAVAEINWECLPDRDKFDTTLANLRQKLPTLRSNNTIYLLGHSHIDMAWLWAVNETWEVAQRTFESVLKLSQEFPNLTFCNSTPALYAWIEQHRPDLFSAIQEKVATGCWEVVGGMWVEPDLNLISGESIVRQILYAQRYVLGKFGQLSKVAWLPDTFGFCGQLPQFLKQGGIEYFVTQKLRWNDTTEFPYGAFWWQAPDGTQIFSLMSASIGEDINPIKMASYASDWETQTLLKDALWLPGVGDHGGGPTRDMLEVAQRWQQSPCFPRLQFTTAAAYLQQIHLKSTFPVWNDELYLEFHRGCYTTHGEQKRWNRRCEGLLYQAELFAALANISTGMVYPKAELEEAWKKVLFNQFHDILPGTAIPEVYVEANQAWQQVEQVGEEILEMALRSIASHVTLPPPPQPDAQAIIVFNPLNWERSEVVALPLIARAGETNWRVYDLAGQPLPTQLSQNLGVNTLLFLAKNVTGIGYCVFWLCPSKPETIDKPLGEEEITPKGKESAYCTTTLAEKTDSDEKKYLIGKNWILENELLRVIVDCDTGDLSSVFDKVNHREILDKAGGNQLQSFEDRGQYWDGWNIDPNYAQHPLPATELKSVQWVEQGQVQQRLRVVRQLGKSEFCQDYVLSAGSSVLKISTTVDWQERHVLVKAVFPVTVTADYATYEIPCGAIERLTQPQEPKDKAKWEVPALRWADLSEDNYGVSLLNDGKYGYDCQPNQLRLTLLRSPSWPDPEADKGTHEFTYAVYPHKGSWQSAQTVRRGYELNLPLRGMLLPKNSEVGLPAIGRLLDLQADNLILMAFKQSEDNPQQWLIRCYECHGEEAQLQLHSDLGLRLGYPVDLLERPVRTHFDGQTWRILPWKIVSFTVSLLDYSNPNIL